MRKLCFCLSLIFIFHLSLAGQKQVIGKVLDKTSNETLIGANIILIQDISIGTTSDIDGNFALSIPDSILECELLIQYLGYKELLFELKNNSDNIEILLEQMPITIEEINIVATPNLGEEFVVKEISKLEIYTNPNSRADPIRAVNSLPASTSTDETANLSLRGSPPSETSFVLNRVPIDDAFKLDQSNGVGQFSIFNTSMISKVDVYPSNPPLEFGGSSSGLISIFTEDFDRVNSRSINLTMASVGFKIDQMINHNNSIISYANFAFNDGLKAFNPEAFENLISFKSFDAGNYWVSNLSEDLCLKVFNYTLAENYNYLFEHPSHVGGSLQEKTRNQSIINLEKKFPNQIFANLNQGINFTKASYQFGNILHNTNKKDLFTSVNFGRYSEFYSIRIGFSFDIDKLKNDGHYSEYFWALSDSHPKLAYATDELFLIPEYNSYHKFKFTDQITFAIADRRTIAASENVGEFKSNQVNLSYLLNDLNNFKFAFGNYSKFFMPGQQFNKAALVTSRHYSLDYSFTKDRFQINAALYSKNTSYVDRNLKIHGAELFASYSGDNIESSLSFASVDSNFQDEDTSYPSKHDLNYFVRHLLKYKFRGFLEVNSVLFFRSGSYFTEVIDANYHEPTQSYAPIYASLSNRQRLPNYNLWDLSISKLSAVGDGVLILFVSASNVINKKNIAGIEYNEKYQKIGYQNFGKRVIFMGAVYNW